MTSGADVIRIQFWVGEKPLEDLLVLLHDGHANGRDVFLREILVGGGLEIAVKVQIFGERNTTEDTLNFENTVHIKTPGEEVGTQLRHFLNGKIRVAVTDDHDDIGDSLRLENIFGTSTKFLKQLLLVLSQVTPDPETVRGLL